MSENTIQTSIDFPLPTGMLTEKPLSPQGLRLLQEQWNQFNELKKVSLPNNPIRERLNSGKAELAKGTLLHGTTFDIGKIRTIKEKGILSGELIGIPEDSETNYCADFFKVPEDMSVKEYLDWCRQFETDLLPIKKKRGESDYLPTPAYSDSRSIGFIVDATSPEIKNLLQNDAYSDNAPEVIKEIVTQLPRDAKNERTAAILAGIPFNFVNAIVLGGGINAQEIEELKQVVGPDVLLYTVDGPLL